MNDQVRKYIAERNTTLANNKQRLLNKTPYEQLTIILEIADNTNYFWYYDNYNVQTLLRTLRKELKEAKP